VIITAEKIVWRCSYGDHCTFCAGIIPFLFTTPKSTSSVLPKRTKSIVAGHIPPIFLKPDARLSAGHAMLSSHKVTSVKKSLSMQIGLILRPGESASFLL